MSTATSIGDGSVENGYPDASRYIDADIDPGFDRDPYTPLAALLRQAKVVKQEGGTFHGVRVPDNVMFNQAGRDIYLALSYSAARQVASDAENFSSELGWEVVRGTLGEVLLTMDRPTHTRMKKLVLPSMTHRIVNEDLVKIATPIIDDALAAIVERGAGELISQFTSQFPFSIIARIFGVPEHLAQEAEDLFASSLSVASNPERALAALQAMNDMYQQVLDNHRKHPKDNMTAMLLATEVDGVKLTDAEIVSFIKQIVSGGLDTTARQLGNLLYLLLEHPDQFADLRENPDLLENAIFESLRLEPAGGFVPRVAINDVELDGVHIPKGSGVYAVIQSANRDPERWENPDKFDIRRKRQPNLAFGAGAHACLGASLAVAEQRIAMTGVLSKLKNLRKDPARWGDVQLRGYQLRSPTQLPLLWDI